ncbi:hypothetical protein TRFO_31734 [Tritrichomonas foetus]|uniref:Uncharacterized protein n=1 Tax=Tritrichomonas foetus TaxID=1144522 RepID=A0A1J4JQL7_9EUKA|nr:hypothetical protein TRFO_31734 [Tritrichomonas foetus]|eukprot:OHT01463.1 hypothetical protein TRFO_31734 [Tritrichomonas foetus]
MFQISQIKDYHSFCIIVMLLFFFIKDGQCSSDEVEFMKTLESAIFPNEKTAQQLQLSITLNVFDVNKKSQTRKQINRLNINGKPFPCIYEFEFCKDVAEKDTIQAICEIIEKNRKLNKESVFGDTLDEYFHYLNKFVPKNDDDHEQQRDSRPHIGFAQPIPLKMPNQSNQQINSIQFPYQAKHLLREPIAHNLQIDQLLQVHQGGFLQR